MTTKKFLNIKGIDYIVKDIEKDIEALDEMLKISGGITTVPVTTNGGSVVVGYNPSELLKLVG